MIDLDRIEAQLAALTGAADPLPVAPRPNPKPSGKRRQRDAGPPPMATVRELLELGRIDEVDARIAARLIPVDKVTWTTMRALLDGRSDSVHAGIRALVELGEAGDAGALAGAWIQRFWAAFEWGTDAERYHLLDHSRERAYRFDDLGWWGHLTLLLAAMGKADEATRAFDATVALLGGAATGPLALDVVTNLVEAAAWLGDAGRAAAAGRLLNCPAGRLVVVGDGVVCKGSVDRYLALVHAAAGRWADAAECFRRAEKIHGAIGAAPLLARTRQQAAGLPVAA